MSNKDNELMQELSIGDQEIEAMVNEFAPADLDDVQIVEPIATGTADALTAAPIAKAAPEEEAPAQPVEEAGEDTAEENAEEPVEAAEEELPPPPKRPWYMRFLGAIVPHVGDNAFDIVRKCIMIIGILVFVGAATYLVDDLILIPIQNTVLADSLQEQYSPTSPPQLSEEEQNYPYPAGIDEAFKKLYYLNNDVRGWITYQSTDGGATVNADYPIMQSDDNDFYLYHDFNKTYNKNGTLFYDYRNKLDNPTDRNKHAIVYGHNMASGQMFAGLNNLLDGVEYARLAPTFTVNTLFGKSEYKVFAVMVVNNDSADGIPFSYLRTDFADNVDFATFVSEMMARSLYVYGDVDLHPDDEIISLSTCTSYADVHFNDGRTVVVARKVRENEAPTTDVSTIIDNVDVIMPYGWYTNQKLEPHPYYLDPNYVVQPLDTLMGYLATSTAPQNQTTTSFTLTQMNGTFGLIDPITTMSTTSTDTLTTTTMPSIPTLETTTTMAPAATAPYLQSFFVQSTPVNYYVGSSFNYGQTQIIGSYSNGQQFAINPYHCAVTGFDSSRVGTCFVTLHYGNLSASFYVNIISGVSTATPTQATTKATTVKTTTQATTQATTQTTTKPTTTKATTTTVKTTKATTVKTTTTKATTTTVKTTTTTKPTTTTTKPTTTTVTEAPTTTTTVAYIPPVDLDAADDGIPGDTITD